MVVPLALAGVVIAEKAVEITAGLIFGAAVYKGGEVLYNKMANANAAAAAAAASGSTAAVCSTCPPPPGTECGNLYEKIRELTKELAQRRADMLADRPASLGGLGMYELFLVDPYAKIPDPRGLKPDLGRWKGHADQILEKQKNMKRNLKEYRDKKCGVLPPGAETQAELPPPSRPFT